MFSELAHGWVHGPWEAASGLQFFTNPKAAHFDWNLIRSFRVTPRKSFVYTASIRAVPSSPLF
ncbi:MAG: hypothetical protein EBS01_08455 [Verrucomicrobia bacterium]|nr:hypothetical protein [Verrucomicrobiota bacterium]